MNTVLFSGGQDSTTCLYWARERFDNLRAVAFEYGQRHAAELVQARKIADLAKVPFQVVQLPYILSGPLIAQGPVTGNAFAPGRNLLFLSAAICMGSQNIVTGVCQTDYSGYPDCRETFIAAFEMTAQRATDNAGIRVHAPLMHLTKAQTVKMARALHGCWEALSLSLTCYNANRCGTCPACVLRAKGFNEANERDPACIE